jgi:putative polyhydroxyalkanoate system protein
MSLPDHAAQERLSNGDPSYTLKVKRQHSLGIEEAKRRVDQIADELGGKLGLNAEWEGDHMRVHGKGVSGRILVSDDSVEVHVHVGFAMMMFREPIRSAIEGSIDEYIT